MRDRLNPIAAANKAHALELRDGDESLNGIRFLFDDYKCGRWYFEIVDMYRRIFFVGVIPLISQDGVLLVLLVVTRVFFFMSSLSMHITSRVSIYFHACAILSVPTSLFDSTIQPCATKLYMTTKHHHHHHNHHQHHRHH